jgi:uncharacterized membrane protein YvbJ
MYCPKCGTHSSEGDIFCRKCGFPLNTAMPAAAPTPIPQINANIQGTNGIKRKSGYAQAALILGLIGILINPCLIFAIIFGAVALNKMKTDPNLEGRGQALTGLWIGIFGLIIWILALIFIFNSGLYI